MREGKEKMKADIEDNKIPGMLYVLVSFIPWIVYWVLCGTGKPGGILIPFVISSLLVITQIRRLNLMDLTSFLYFIIALAGTSVFSLNIFVESSGVLGYSVLSLMAFLSLIIKQPFTLQSARRDYPEAYWRDRSFLAINNLITIVWMCVFLINAFLLLGGFSVIFSNILIAFGVVFSLIFPLKAAAYLVSREFKRYDWSIEAQNPGEENEYDAIIIGSGIGGLTCGSLLSKRGYKVLVLEQHYQVGGYCSSFQRKGFGFNTGVEDVSGVWTGGTVDHFLKELGLKKEDLFVKNTTRYISKGKEIEANNSEDLIRALSRMFPYENISAFFAEAQKAYEELCKYSSGVPLPAELIVRVLGAKKLLNFPKECPHFYDWMSKTYKQKLDEHFKNEDLKALLCSRLSYLGVTEPAKASGLMALNACVSFYLYGGYFLKAQKFADSLKEFIEDHGGRVLIKSKVDKILIEKREVKGVKAMDKIFRSHVVVSNANAKTTFLELAGANNIDKKYAEYINGLKMSPSCFMVFLGVDMDLSNYPTLIKNLDDGYEFVINSNADPSLAPEWKASLTILGSANYYDLPDRETEEYLQKKNELAEILIQKVEKVIPGLSKRIIVLDAATPKTFERYTLIPEGALYVFDQSIETKRPYFKTPIKGLYLSGASTFPGGGIESVIISGTICANDICNWEVKTE